MQHHKYSLAEIENMIPWERRIYIELLIQHLKEEKEKMEAERMNKNS
jgi:3-methyladenine DNA glycosylase AlkD